MSLQSTNKSYINFTLPFWKRLLFFICVSLVCFLFGSLITSVLLLLKPENVAMIRIATVIQDLFLFITPAIITAIIITRLPARFLAVDSKPGLFPLLLAFLALICSIPFMNSLISWNEGIELPGFLKQLEEMMRQAEDSAKATVELLLGNNSIGATVISILIVGVLAGFSEEIFYRGTFQRLLSTGGINIHVSIWLVAFIFSAMHLQFYGFFPRLLLGAFFGYLLYWTQNLWIPVILHILNNTLYIVGNKFVSAEKEFDFNTFGTTDVILVISSIILTSGCLYFLYRHSLKNPKVAYKANSKVIP